MTVHYLPDPPRLDSFAQALLLAKDYLHSAEVTYSHCGAPEAVWPHLREARAALNAARLTILESPRERPPCSAGLG